MLSLNDLSLAETETERAVPNFIITLKKMHGRFKHNVSEGLQMGEFTE